MVFQAVNGDLQTLLRHVRSFRRELVFRRLLGFLLLLAGCGAGAAGAVDLLFVLMPWTVFPFILDLIALVLLISCAATVIILYTRRISAATAARMMEKQSPIPHLLLSVAVELSQGQGQGSPHLIETVYRAASGQLDRITRSFPCVHLKRNGIIFAFASAFFLLSIIPQPSLVRFWKLPFTVVTNADVRISPGSITVARNGSADLQLIMQNHRYPSCRLTTTTPSTSGQRTFLLRSDSNGTYSLHLDSLTKSFHYRFSAGPRIFPAESITVLPPPYLKALQVRLVPPSYLHMSSGDLKEGQGSFSAFPGTRAHVSAGVDGVRSARLIYNGDSIPMKVDGSTVSGDMTIAKGGSYTFSFVDTLDQPNDSLPSFHVSLVEDEPPAVQILKPAFNKNLTPAQMETLWVEGIDDFGIRDLRLYWYRTGGDTIIPELWDLSEKNSQKTVRKQLVWDLRELSLYPGDTIYYWAFTRDNKPWGRPQTAVSDTFWFRVPSFEEIQAGIESQQEDAREAIKDAKGRQDRLESSIEKLMKSATGRKELTWEQRQILDDVKQNIQAQSDSLNKAVEKLKENIERMKESGMAGNEVLEKMDQVRKSLEDILKQYGDSLLFDLRRKEDNQISWQEMKKAVEKLNELLPDLDQRLENTLKYLEMLKRDMRLSSLSSRSSQLSKEQAELSQAQNDKQTPAREKDLLDRIKELSKDVSAETQDDSSGLMDQNTPSKHAIDSLSANMRSQLSKGTMPQQRSMNQMSGSLLSLSQELRQMLSSNEAAMMQKERERLLDLANDALAMKEWQEQIGDEAFEKRNAENTAKQQQALKEALNKSRIKSDSLSMLPPSMMHGIREAYERATEATRKVLNSTGQPDVIMQMQQNGTAFNGLAATLLDAVAAMDGGHQGGGGMGGMMPGLRRLSGKQAAINAATADLLRSLLNQGSSQGGDGTGGSEEARRQAREAQNALADELKKLADKYGDQAGEGMQQKMKELEEEAKKLAQMMTAPDRELTERQDRFLARMLQTTLSLHREEEGKEERKSRSAATVFSNSDIPSPGSLNLDPDTFYRIRRKAFDGNFPESYRAAVKAYFDSLGVLYLKE